MLVDRTNEIEAAINSIWVEMGALPIEQRRTELPLLADALRRLETRLMVLRQGVDRSVAMWTDLVPPQRAGAMADIFSLPPGSTRWVEDYGEGGD